MYINYKSLAYGLAYTPRVTLREFISDLHDDSLARRGLVHGSNHLVFVAGLPKSGTTWLESLFESTPGLVQLNKSLLRKFPWNIYRHIDNSHDIHESMLSCAPENLFSYLKLHAHPTPNNFGILQANNVKTIVLLRDLRDMLLSRLYHILSQPDHPYHDKLTALNFSDALYESFSTDTLDGYGQHVTALDYYVDWCNGWLDLEEKNNSSVKVIKFEEMKSDLHAVLQGIFQFFDYDAGCDVSEIITKQQKLQQSRKMNDLSKGLQVPGRSVSTLRKGLVGGFREHFSDRHLSLVNDKAGHVLKRLGYLDHA